jgi:hypothetical protein
MKPSQKKMKKQKQLKLFKFKECYLKQGERWDHCEKYRSRRNDGLGWAICKHYNTMGQCTFKPFLPDSLFEI